MEKVEKQLISGLLSYSEQGHMQAINSKRSKNHLCGGLVLRRHSVAPHWHTGVLPTGLLLLLEILVVGHLLLLLVGHVAGMHSRGTGHVGLLSIDIAGVDILGSLCWDFRRIDSILVGGGIGGVQASLEHRRLGMSRQENKTTQQTHLNEVLALRLGNQWLKLRGGKSIDQTGLGHHQQQHLSTREDGQFICLCDRKNR